MGRPTVCFITGTRADYGHQFPLFLEILKRKNFEFKLIVTGSHLSEKFGMTINEILADKIPIVEKIEILDESNGEDSLANSMASAVKGIGTALVKMKPDLLVLFGDRFEILAAAQAGWLSRIPIAHIGGGDITEGSYDDGFRHCLTKLSSLHYPTNLDAKKIIGRLGELESTIKNVGSLCIDNILRNDRRSKEKLSESLDFEFQEQNILVTFHPETSTESHKDPIELFNALNSFKDLGIIITLPNFDQGTDHIIELINGFCKSHPYAKSYSSLGQINYYSALDCVDVVVGNSSSGIYEVPSFGIPTINIGDRQKGRIQAVSIINSKLEESVIKKSLEKALAIKKTSIENPYGDGNTASKIADDLERSLKAGIIKKDGFVL